MVAPDQIFQKSTEFLFLRRDQIEV